MYQWIERDMGKGGHSCCGVPRRGAGLTLTDPSPPVREVHPERGRDVRRPEPPGGPRETAVPHHQQPFQFRVSPVPPREDGAGWGPGSGGQAQASSDHMPPVLPLPHVCPGTRECGIWWVPTGASSLMWSSSRRTSLASSPTHASMGLAGAERLGSGDWSLLATLCVWGGDTPFPECGPREQVAFVSGMVPGSLWSPQTGNQVLTPPPPPRPFRKLDERGSLQWDRITRLEKGKIYRQVRANRGD